ncbi:Aldo/keto reductase family protein [compost metagenome]
MLVAISGERGVSPAQVALAWLIGRKGVTSVIIGGRTEAQFSDNLAAAGLKLSDEEKELLDAVSLPPVIYPYWHQLRSAKDRLGEADLSLLGPHL